ncbi:MAG: hypothetical protein HFG89_10825 [Dorea sp.]|jgi:hypothetical protein|nr:hypothetical protein [Dorea sp.]
MDEARRKIRICLFCIVMIAALMGVVYYMNDVRGGSNMEEGTLVRQDISFEEIQTMRDAGMAEGRG